MVFQVQTTAFAWPPALLVTQHHYRLGARDAA